MIFAVCSRTSLLVLGLKCMHMPNNVQHSSSACAAVSYAACASAVRCSTNDLAGSVTTDEDLSGAYAHPILIVKCALWKHGAVLCAGPTIKSCRRGLARDYLISMQPTHRMWILLLAVTAVDDFALSSTGAQEYMTQSIHAYSQCILVYSGLD